MLIDEVRVNNPVMLKQSLAVIGAPGCSVNGLQNRRLAMQFTDFYRKKKRNITCSTKRIK